MSRIQGVSAFDPALFFAYPTISDEAVEEYRWAFDADNAVITEGGYSGNVDEARSEFRRERYGETVIGPRPRSTGTMDVTLSARGRSGIWKSVTRTVTVYGDKVKNTQVPTLPTKLLADRQTYIPLSNPVNCQAGIEWLATFTTEGKDYLFPLLRTERGLLLDPTCGGKSALLHKSGSDYSVGVDQREQRETLRLVFDVLKGYMDIPKQDWRVEQVMSTSDTLREDHFLLEDLTEGSRIRLRSGGWSALKRGDTVEVLLSRVVRSEATGLLNNETRERSGILTITHLPGSALEQSWSGTASFLLRQGFERKSRSYFPTETGYAWMAQKPFEAIYQK